MRKNCNFLKMKNPLQEAIKSAFQLASGPVNTGSTNLGYGNCIDGFGDIKQLYPQGYLFTVKLE